VQECELCGRKTETAYLVSVEEVELGVCARCAKGKHVISEIKETQKGREAPEERQKYFNSEPEIVEDYGKRMKEARERMKIPIKVLAEMLNEKETLLSRVEQQKTLPPEELRKKLERALGITLQESERSEQKVSMIGRKSQEGATLGEFA
jgi:putative transcription factor